MIKPQISACFVQPFRAYALLFSLRSLGKSQFSIVQCYFESSSNLLITVKPSISSVLSQRFYGVFQGRVRRLP